MGRQATTFEIALSVAIFSANALFGLGKRIVMTRRCKLCNWTVHATNVQPQDRCCPPVEQSNVTHYQSHRSLCLAMSYYHIQKLPILDWITSLAMSYLVTSQ